MRALLGFAFFWQVSQALGLTSLGEYLYVTTALGYFGSLIDYGFNLYVLNTASRTPGTERALFLRVVLSKLILTSLSFAILTGLYGLAFAAEGALVTAVFLAVVVLQSFSGLLIQFFKAMGRFEHEFSSTMLGSVLPVVSLFALQGPVTLLTLGWIVLAVRLAVILFQLVLFFWISQGQGWRSAEDGPEHPPLRALLDILGNFKYALFSVLGAVFLSVDLVVMRFVLGPEDVSIYGTAMKVILAGILFFEVINGTFTPRLAKFHASQSDSFDFEVKRFIAMMFALSATCAIVIFIVGPAVIMWAFGPEFAESGRLVRFLSLVLMLRVTEMTTGPLLTVYGLQAFRALAMAIVLPIHLGLNLVLQNQFGIWGAVGALSFSFLLLFALNSLYLIRKRPGTRA
jgi:O-antigen/teichoic acid export membrane protein